MVASKLIDQFEDVANRLMANAGQQGDILTSKAGDEFRIAKRNLDLALGDQRDRTFEQLTPQLKSAFIALNGMIDAVNQASNTAVSISEMLNLDLIEFTKPKNGTRLARLRFRFGPRRTITRYG